MKRNAEWSARRLASLTLAAGVAGAAPIAVAQETQAAATLPVAEVAKEAPATSSTEKAVVSGKADKADKSVKLEKVQVTGSRITRVDYTASSPVTTVTREEIGKTGDVTLESFLNTLPQVNPTLTSTSNNPGNGQATIDLRGLGSNRNLVLIDGRRPMPSTSSLTVDFNTIPDALVDRIEIVSGGAGAAYGADAVAGAVNIITKKKFEGVDLRATWSDSEPKHDSVERKITGLFGKNFMGGKGNFVIGGEYADREQLVKSQRGFATFATSTTGSLPEGLYNPTRNNPSQAAVNSVFGAYGVPAGAVVNNLSLIGFNLDGTLFSRGVFNNTTLDVQNFRYPVDASVNQRFFPDLYSYNFDSINVLVLPLEKYSGMGKFSYKIFDDTEFFAQSMWTNYTNFQALAPTPVGGATRNPNRVNPGFNAGSALVTDAINPTTGTPFQVGGLLIPTTNPFIPADLATLLASRGGDNPAIVGSGATEPFLLGQRTLPAGLRKSIYENTVRQNLFGFRGDLTPGWDYEISFSEGKTETDVSQEGNINFQRLQDLLAEDDGGASICQGGYNPFGRKPLSQDCVNYISVLGGGSITKFEQRIFSGTISGTAATLPAGDASVVFGGEHREFQYESAAKSGDVYFIGFNTSEPDAGKVSFNDVFAETLIPVVADLPYAKKVEVGLGYRLSSSEFTDELKGTKGGSKADSAYKFDVSWQIVDALRGRLSYQKSVRAPNFGELFGGGGGFPQFFDPCGRSSEARNGEDAVAVRDLCVATGIAGTAINNFVPAPGGQVLVNTSGNTELDPETGRTTTVGLVFTSPWGGLARRLSASLDYYQIRVSDPILVPDANLIIAGCYNYFGTNPDYKANNALCKPVIAGRAAGGGDLNGAQLENPADPVNGAFPGINGGSIKTSGLDFQTNWGFNAADVNLPSKWGRINTSLLVNYLLQFKQQDADFLPTIDYADSVAYFGQGNSGAGGSLPRIRATWNTTYNIDAFSVDVRARYIDGMKNRASLQFPGETAFTGVGAVTYWDIGAGWKATKNIQVRAGLNNVFDKQPPSYRPNVQSGTDPSLYDVIGRRVLGQLIMTF